MAKKKKVKRKELLNKPDEFITFSSKLFQFVSAHQTEIFYGLIIFVGLMVAVTGFTYYSHKAEKRASDLLGMAMNRYEAVKSQSGPLMAYQAVEKEAERLVETYSNKTAGRLATLWYADISYRAGEWDKAIALYTKSLNHFDNDSTVKYFILNGLGYCYEAKNDNRTAEKYFQKIATGGDNVMKGEAYFNLGRIYAEMGEQEKAMAAFQRVISDYEDSMHAELVKERLAGGTK